MLDFAASLLAELERWMLTASPAMVDLNTFCDTSDKLVGPVSVVEEVQRRLHTDEVPPWAAARRGALPSARSRAACSRWRRVHAATPEGRGAARVRARRRCRASGGTGACRRPWATCPCWPGRRATQPTTTRPRSSSRACPATRSGPARRWRAWPAPRRAAAARARAPRPRPHSLAPRGQCAQPRGAGAGRLPEQRRAAQPEPAGAGLAARVAAAAPGGRGAAGRGGRQRGAQRRLARLLRLWRARVLGGAARGGRPGARRARAAGGGAAGAAQARRAVARGARSASACASDRRREPRCARQQLGPTRGRSSRTWRTRGCWRACTACAHGARWPTWWAAWWRSAPACRCPRTSSPPSWRPPRYPCTAPRSAASALPPRALARRTARARPRRAGDGPGGLVAEAHPAALAGGGVFTQLRPAQPGHPAGAAPRPPGPQRARRQPSRA